MIRDLKVKLDTEVLSVYNGIVTIAIFINDIFSRLIEIELTTD